MRVFAHAVFGFAPSLLHLSFDLFRFAFYVIERIVRQVTLCINEFAPYLLDLALDAIFVHCKGPFSVRSHANKDIAVRVAAISTERTNETKTTAGQI